MVLGIANVTGRICWHNRARAVIVVFYFLNVSLFLHCILLNSCLLGDRKCFCGRSFDVILPWLTSSVFVVEAEGKGAALRLLPMFHANFRDHLYRRFVRVP